ncbi:hypothetical protein PF001_g23631 [Phytophthora fragariae]|uniref:Uncharacterized protein n=1 Tax=Phytophthora fragariae TaxID=53985 RepID=A0A6A4C0E8_9STRA|nr:hypothetical protein PF001_g23631 [Phytophthora fragariae]
MHAPKKTRRPSDGPSVSEVGVDWRRRRAAVEATRHVCRPRVVSPRGRVPVVETRGRVDGETELPVLDKRRRSEEVVMKASGDSNVVKAGGESIVAKTSGESIGAGVSVESAGAGVSVESAGAKTDGESKSAAVDMELSTVYVSAEVMEGVRQDVTSEHAEASVIAQCGSTATDDGAEEEQKPPIPDGVRRQMEKMSGGRTAAARRRKRRAEGAVAAAHGVLAAEVRERREERAKVLRVVVRQVIAELREQADLKQRRWDHREAQIAAAVVKKAEAARNQHTKPAVTQVPTAKQSAATQTEEEWLAATSLRALVEAPAECWECGGSLVRHSTSSALRSTALLMEGQGDELLIGEDWMVERQVKMDFGSRELKYQDMTGQKVILPFTCHGVSTLQQAGQERRAVVRLAKTVKLATNTRSVVQMKVDAEDGTTGVFLPKPT